MGDNSAFDTTGPLAGMSAPVPEGYVEEEIDVAEIELELDKLDQRLKTDSDNVNTLTRYGELCLKIDKKERALPAVKRGLEIFAKNPISASQGIAICDVAINAWKADRYIAKNSIRVNYNEERRMFLNGIKEVLTELARMRDPSVHDIVNLKLAYIKECTGGLQDAISILSDLITAQASNGVDLSFIILRAAVLIKHMGGTDQAIEYLEFLQDDPPVAAGYGQTHVLAFMTLVLEQVKGHKRDAGLIAAMYDKLKKVYIKEMSSTNKGERKNTEIRQKLERLFQQKPIHTGSEIWEQLALQSVDRCEYVFAAELLSQACEKAPTKSRLLQLLAEVYNVLGQKDRCYRIAERVYVLQPQSAEIRNLLVSLHPEKWVDKLRTVAPSKPTTVNQADEERKIREAQHAKVVRLDGLGDDDGESFMDTMKSMFRKDVGSPEERAKAMQDKVKAREREEKKKIKEKEKKEREKKMAQAAEKKKQEDLKKPKKKTQSMLLKELPPRPKPPEMTAQARKVLDKILEGNENIYIYDPIVRELAEIRKQTILKEQIGDSAM